MPSPACPPEEHFSSLLSGRLEPASANRLEQHIETCDRCQQTVRSLSIAGDSLLDALRQSSAVSLEVEPGCERAMAHIRAFAGDGTVETIGYLQDELPKLAAEPELKAIREYQLLEKLGEGGMGAVYKAVHARLDKTVALKLLPRGRTRDQAAVARFQREMKAVGKLEHAHIVRAMDAGEADGMHFLVMEYVQGMDLSELSRRLGQLPVADACELIRQAALGLAEAHEHGMVHRDIKPSNLILAEPRRKQEQATVKVLDLGLALLAGEAALADDGLTGTGQVMGTVDYMAPEQCRSSHDVDIRADIYSLGATLYRLLSGSSPLGSDRDNSILSKLVALATRPVRPLAELRPDVPPALAKVVHCMLAKEPAERFASPDAVVDALSAFCSGANLVALLKDAESAPEARDTAPDKDTLANRTSQSSDTAPKVQKPAKPAKAGWWNRLPPGARKLTLAAGAGAATMLAGVVLYWVTGIGIVRFEVDDPTIKIRFEDETAFIERPNEETLRLWPGKRKLHVERGQDFRFDTTDIELTRGEKITLKVQLLPGDKIQVVRSDGTTDKIIETREPPALASSGVLPPPKIAEPPPLAEWLKGRQVLTVSQDGKGQFKSIEAALKALRPSQVVEVLDRGPYREFLHVGGLPQDTGLISRHDTVIETPSWEQGGKDVYWGVAFGPCNGFRLSGISFVAPDRKEYGGIMVLHDSAGIVIENCHFARFPGNGEGQATILISVQSTGNTDARTPPVLMKHCHFQRGTIELGAAGESVAPVALEQNYFDRSGLASVAQRFQRMIIRGNIFADPSLNGSWMEGLEEVEEGLEFSNNTCAETTFHFGKTAPIKNVTIRNNLTHSGVSLGFEARDITRELKKNWQQDHNGFILPTLLRSPSDVLSDPEFLSSDSNHRDYLRIPIDNAHATGGAGGNWPQYLGALPPGPAPKDGDWFTRLRERWVAPLKAASGAADLDAIYRWHDLLAADARAESSVEPILDSTEATKPAALTASRLAVDQRFVVRAKLERGEDSWSFRCGLRDRDAKHAGLELRISKFPDDPILLAQFLAIDERGLLKVLADKRLESEVKDQFFIDWRTVGDRTRVAINQKFLLTAATPPNRERAPYLQSAAARLNISSWHGRGALDDHQDSPDRQAAEWAIALGGSIGAVDQQTYTRLDQLPTRFQIGFVGLSKCPDDVNGGLQLLTKVETLGALSLSFTNLSDEGMKHVGGMRELNRLDIQNTPITGTGFKSLASHPNLLTLWLNETLILNDDLSVLATLPQLEQLSLPPDASDSILPTLLQLKNLRSLNTSGTRISAEGKAAWQRKELPPQD